MRKSLGEQDCLVGNAFWPDFGYVGKVGTMQRFLNAKCCCKYMLLLLLVANKKFKLENK